MTESNETASGRPLVAVLDYGIGNLRSAQKALERVGADARLTADPGLISEADGVVLPGVGHFGTCMRQLRVTGLEQPALQAIESGLPFLGICVGMQMLFEASQEAPGIPGLGVMPGTVRLLPDGMVRPQMQWNRLDVQRPGCPLLAGLEDGAWMYFVHSYAPDTEAGLVVATCDYPTPITAVTQSGRTWATQFHPEKSGDAGKLLAQNFLAAVAADRCSR
ncbi:imidazole glycerol phosphate synthase subunit HisH [Candidatus Poriferisodalis sp.]|uniref:imidazole glycerol phosphate synthase subunit HisH n=1 Tax=Candidatus Poriferisodalis sp. TaxID=3101277 RepID=UPI003B5A4654